MSWRSYFENATLLINRTFTELKIVNYAPEYFKKLSKVISDHLTSRRGKMYVPSAHIEL